MVIGTKMSIGMEIMGVEEAIIITMEEVLATGIKMSTEMETMMAEEAIIAIIEEEVVLAEVLQAKEGVTGLMVITGIIAITGIMAISTGIILDKEEVTGMTLAMVYLVKMVPLMVTKVLRILLLSIGMVILLLSSVRFVSS